jgi:peptide/nickel transport system permease protein
MAMLSHSLKTVPTKIGASKFFRRFYQHVTGLLGVLIILLFGMIALFAPLLAKPQGQCAVALESTTLFRMIFAPPAKCFEVPRLSVSSTPKPPTKQTPLGTVNGYDIFYALVWGTRTAFGLGLSVVSATLLLGLTVGLLAGYFGGLLDELLMRFTDVVFALPSLVLTIVLVTLLGASISNVMVSMIVVGWASYARLVRGEVLRVRTLEFVEGAKALGASNTRIILRHVLPNSVTTLGVQAALDLGAVVLQAAALSFIGLGAPVGYADWGQLVNFSQGFIIGPPHQPFAYWFVSLFPGLTILVWGLAWNFLGDALRDTLDPKGG